MAATNYTPIQLYYSTTASAAPVAGNLANGELAINITDGKLYYKDNSGTVQVIATKGAGTIGGSNTQIQYNNSGALAGSSAMTFNSGTNTVTLTTLNLTNALGATYGGTAQSSYTQGDILYSSATNTLSKLGIGTVDYILTSTGSVPQWVAPTSVTVQTANNLAGGSGGSVPYQSAASTTTFLSIGSSNTVMTSSGTAPQWSSSLTGLLSVSSSGITNVSLTSGRVVYSTTGGAQTDSSNLTFNGTTLSAGGYSTTGLTTLVKTVTIGNGNFSGVAVFEPNTPAKLYLGNGTVTDTTSAIGATNATGAIASLAVTPIAATNTSVTYTNAATLYIAGAPSAGTNITITNPYALYVAAGKSYFGGDVVYAGGITLNGNVTVGDSSSDTLTINSTITSNLIFTDNTYDIGASGANRPRSIFLSGNATTAGGVAVGTSLTVGGDTTMSGNQVFNNNAAIGNTSKLIRGQAYGGAIRFAGNSATATDRGLQLGVVDNANAFTQIVSIDGDSYFVSVRGGVNSNSTQLQMATDSTTLSPTNFYTISNRGTGTTQTGTYTIGGILFGGYRDVRNPANVAGVWAERVNASGGLASAGRLYLGVSGGGTNITQDGALPSDAGYALLNENGNWLIGTQTSSGRLTVANDPTGAIGLGSFTSGNGTAFQIASAAGSGQYMATAVAGDAILRETAYGLCIGTNTSIKFGNTVSEFGRFDTSGRLLVGVNAADATYEGGMVLKAQKPSYAAQIFNVIQVGNLGTPNDGDIAGIGFNAGESTQYGVKGSIGFVRNSTFGRGFFGIYLNNTAGAAAMTSADERYRFNADSAGFFTTTVASGLQLQVGSLGSGSRGGIYLPGAFNFDGLYLRQATSDQRGASIELVSHTNASNSTSYKIQASNDTDSRVLTFQYAADASAYSSLSYTKVAQIENDGSLWNTSGYYKAYQSGRPQNITLNSLASGQSVYAYTQYIIKDSIGSGGDPAYYYIALCPAYQGGATQSKAYFTGFIYFTRGSGSAGNNFSACYVSVASAYNSNVYGGKNLGNSALEIVTFLYAGTAWIGVRFASVQSAVDVTVDGKYASSAVPAIIADGSVSSVTVQFALPV